uniref:Reverse transcriptase domain-containing protein n=1 Tax=Caenorhabditis japonica TaxID=281687 RepID=A0A8R1IPQ6_CAEJA
IPLNREEGKVEEVRKAKRAGGERSWDPVRFKNTITECSRKIHQHGYEELTESIKNAGSTATHATHPLSKISEATKKMMMSRFQMIHAGQTKNADLAKIQQRSSKILWKMIWTNGEKVKSLQAAVKGRSLKKTKRALTLKSSPVYEFRTAGWINDIQSSRDQEANEPEILQHEVEHAIVTSKTNISPGPDQITMLQLKLGIESIAPHLTAALNQVLTNGRTPEDWKTVKISLLPKTTKPKKVKDYRPVALSSIVSKLFTKILTRRITAKSEDYLEESQAG